MSMQSLMPSLWGRADKAGEPFPPVRREIEIKSGA